MHRPACYPYQDHCAAPVPSPHQSGASWPRGTPPAHHMPRRSSARQSLRGGVTTRHPPHLHLATVNEALPYRIIAIHQIIPGDDEHPPPGNTSAAERPRDVSPTVAPPLSPDRNPHAASSEQHSNRPSQSATLQVYANPCDESKAEHALSAASKPRSKAP